jgi:serine/threonine-protein kinase RsbW
VTSGNKRLDVRLAAEAASVGTVRAAVVDFAQQAGVEDTGRLALAVSEAMSNVVIHAYRDIEPGDMRVVACNEPDRLVVVVRDYGQGMRPRADSPGLGMGLPLISQMTDDLQIEAAQEAGTLLRMHFMKPLAKAA